MLHEVERNACSVWYHLLNVSESLTLHPPRITCNMSNCIPLLYLLNRITLGMNNKKKKSTECNHLQSLKYVFWKLTRRKIVTFATYWYVLHRVLSLSLSTIHIPSKNNILSSSILHSICGFTKGKAFKVFSTSLCTDGEENKSGRSDW